MINHEKRQRALAWRNDPNRIPEARLQETAWGVWKEARDAGYLRQVAAEDREKAAAAAGAAAVASPPVAPARPAVEARATLSHGLSGGPVLVEQHRRADPAPNEPGFLGLEPMTALANGQLCAQLGEHTMQVSVVDRAPAWRAGARSGDYLKSIRTIDGAPISLLDFNAMALPAGTNVLLELYREGRGKASGSMTVFATLKAPPKVKAPPRWQARPRVACGKDVSKEKGPWDRYSYEKAMRKHPFVGDLGLRVLMTLLNDYDGPNGAFPGYARLAHDLGRTRRAIIENVERLNWLGVLDKVKFGGAKGGRGRTNRYRPCWPDGWGANVVKLSARHVDKA